ncbi:MAG TPA: hypothetical protein VE954_09240 [Oligoflexus sp.]|uniref:hypothetical protein n=1 Tax=Oligoflexus sp. TaxID=1971216 RepID=UPI002D6E37F2|nr:hypothetical protein [Oligoflexus sp.]HYX33285.1 hypothetical protein [Oligoflexus sp.]
MLSFRRAKLLAFSWVLATAAQAETEELRYTFKDLQIFWTNTLANQEQEAWRAYNEILVPPSASGGAGAEDDPFNETIFAEETATGKQQSFPVEPLPSAYAGLFVSREIALHMFLQKALQSQFFKVTRPGENALAEIGRIAVEKNTLQNYKHQAESELYLLNVLRYREASSLAQKCRRLNEANRYYSFAAQDALYLKSVGSLNAGDILGSIYNRYFNEFTKASVCNVKPLSTVASQRSRIEKKLNDSILSALAETDKDLIQPIAKVQAETFGELEKDLKAIDPKTKEIFEFHSLVKGSQAAIEIVADDGFKLESLFTSANTLDFDKLKAAPTPGVNPEAVQKVNDAQKVLLDDLKTFFQNLSLLPADVSMTSELSACTPLLGLYNRIFPDTTWDLDEQKNHVTPLLNKLKLCMESIDARITTLDADDDSNQYFKAFTGHLTSLNKIVISVGS